MEDALEVLLEDGVIDEVLGRLKSGKEANISLVRRGDVVMAAKVYKDRTTRSFKNNADYKEGRKVRNTRTQRAMDSGGKFGRDAAEQAWKSAEADALFKLVGSGVRIPTPIMFYEGVLLMDLVRDAEGHAAPRLIDVAITKEAAVGLYADLVAQIISMLCCDLIHGDLSPYNILAAVDGPTIIDFPQVISAVHSSRAEYFFIRDFDNIVAFVSGFDPSLSVHTADGRAIWRAYVSRDLTPEYVPPPPPPPRATRGPDRRSRPDDRGRPPQRRDGRGPQQNGPQQRNGPPPRFEHNRQQQQQPPNGSQQRSDGRGPPPPRFEHNRQQQQQPPNGSQQRSDGRGPPPPRFDHNRQQQQPPNGSQQRSDGRGPPPPRFDHNRQQQQPQNGPPQNGPQQQRPDPRTPRGYEGRGPQQQPDPRWPQPFDRQPQQPRVETQQADLRRPPPPAAPRFDRPAPPRGGSSPRGGGFGGGFGGGGGGGGGDGPRVSNGPRKRRPRRRG